MYYGNNLDKPTGNVIIDLKRVATLGTEPITLEEAKTQLRVTFDDDDTEITALITKARVRVENYCNISIVTQRIQLICTLDSYFDLPYGPVISIESVNDAAGFSGSGPVSYPNSDIQWQLSDGRFYTPSWYQHKIVYTAGMSTCPADLKDAILNVLVFEYENRGKVPDADALAAVLKWADNYRKLWI